MSDTCPTVEVESENGPYIMNESDYDPKVHTLVSAKAAAPKAPTNDEMKATLADAGVDVPSGAKKKDLVKLIAELPTSDA